MSKLLINPVRIPKQMPSDWILKQIAFPPPKEYYSPKTLESGKICPPKISYRNQLRIRHACILANISPESIGLPPVPVESPKRFYDIKGSKAPQKIHSRALKIEQNMKEMPQRVAAWRAEKRKQRLAAVPEMPF